MELYYLNYYYHTIKHMTYVLRINTNFKKKDYCHNHHCHHHLDDDCHDYDDDCYDEF